MMQLACPLHARPATRAGTPRTAGGGEKRAPDAAGVDLRGRELSRRRRLLTIAVAANASEAVRCVLRREQKRGEVVLTANGDVPLAADDSSDSEGAGREGEASDGGAMSEDGVT